jgi:protein-disulfide isomerase
MRKNNFSIPIAIIIAGVLIAGALLYNSKSASNDNGNVAESNKKKLLLDSDNINVKPVNENDHILGSINAPIKIIEFSDLECPFCKQFHQTMKQVIDEYGKDGTVAWVYRHFPLDQLHPKARKEAEASECAAELGGNDKFWQYLNRLFEITPSNNGLNLSLLPQIAEDVGLDRFQFKQCLESGKYARHIADDLEDAVNSGGRGTPYSILIAPNGDKFKISGAQPYQVIRSIIEKALKED